ncbi:MAG: NAD(P)-dependent oxidoreductase [Rhodobacteraceae bacterium]|nr:NAD(P)-dependent oxidoreductase [Paracoccaceae bacterium]
MGALTILITGANGFLGRACTEAALARGHKVRALVRSEGAVLPGVEVFTADLADAPPFAAVDGVDAVIHAAATLSPDAADQARDTLGATLNLLAALEQHPARLVLVSSMSVYAAPAKYGTIDEHSPLEPQPRQRDAYMRAKLAQEGAAMAHAKATGQELRVMRAGAIFGPGRIWNAHLGLRKGNTLLRLGGTGELPLTYIDHCAEALVIGAETSIAPINAEAAPTNIDIINVVDDDLPDRSTYIQAMTRAGWPRLVLPLPWRVLDFTGPYLAKLPKIGSRLPGLFKQPTLRARMAPARYSNAKLNALGWQPKLSFQAAMDAAQSGEIS